MSHPPTIDQDHSETDSSKGFRGRPGLPPQVRRSERFAVRLSPQERDKLDRLGGSTWLHRMIDEAPDPEPPATA